MTGWSAVFPALLFLLAQGAFAAENSDEAARELARRIAAFAGSRESVALDFRSLPSIPAADLSNARRAIEASLRDLRARLETTGTIEVRVTLSESPKRRILVGEARRGEDRQTWVVSWPAEAVEVQVHDGMRLDRKLVWEQAEPILDAAIEGDSLLVLSVSRLTHFARQESGWKERQSIALPVPKPKSRDPRGRLILRSSVVRVFLPAATCKGSVQPALSFECKASDEPWPIESGDRHLLLADYVAGRNYFDGRITTQAGVRKSLTPFYSAAAVEESGETLWLMAGTDGRTVLMDRVFTPGGVLGGWGSDLAGLGTRCGALPVLTTRPGDQTEALQAYVIVNRQAHAFSPPLAMAGPVTALWPAPEGAIAVVRDPVTEKYAAYLVTISCGQ